MSKTKTKKIEVLVAGIVLDSSSNTPIVILKSIDQDICLPVWVGINEASSISDALQGIVPTRPMTHDLITSIVDNTNVNINSICINGIDENTFFASIELSTADEIKDIDSRPSDAIAIAVRVECPIFIEKKLFDTHGINITEIFPKNDQISDREKPHKVSIDQKTSKEEKNEPNEEETFSQGIFFVELNEEKMKEILQDVKPEDFKYKI